MMALGFVLVFGALALSWLDHNGVRWAPASLWCPALLFGAALMVVSFALWLWRVFP